MRPNELVGLLLEGRGLSTYAAAKAMHKASFQPTLHKFLAGDVASPEHSTAQRIADYLELPLEAIYDSAAATRIARERGLIKGSYRPSTPPAPAQPHAAEPVPIARYQASRAPLPADLMARIETLSATQLEGLRKLVLVYLDQVAPLATAASSKHAKS